ncbi:uncharacterized protein E0L32_004502 [Thyridium curvatum]|uniref:LSM domain-containing protein n=1 Tax=Thyridium curvatum TaxID=1093900 RepID=A0A507AZV4_9PEZI|nr:uncharacterized protein E0L32_004502 [Thyridium curvatum]TPX15522.1 hypothetical protein E0L32_004502 [Thyridium curvatum]
MDRSEAPVVEPGDTAKAAACSFLESLINKNIRIHTTDTRMFRGEFKCTDPLAAQAASASAAGSSDKVAVDMTSRYLGLVVVPGQYIVKMELEEFASQAKKQLA